MAERVCHVVLSLAAGGLERLVVAWTNARNQQHPASTVVCCLDEPGVLAGCVQGNAVVNVQARRSRFPWDGGAVRRLAAVHAGALHAHNMASLQYAVLAAGKRRRTVLYTRHGLNPHDRTLINRLRGALLVRRCAAVTAVSAEARAAVARDFWVPFQCVRLIPNGIDVTQWRPDTGARQETREALGIPAEAFVVGSVGRLVRVKGYDRLLAACAAVSDQRSVVSDSHANERVQQGGWPHLLLVGDGVERGMLERQADSLGIKSRVRFVGDQADVRPFMTAMDLFVLPSRSEGLSVALLEAMAVRVPVAVTDVGESRTVVQGGADASTGNDTNSTATACGFLLPDEERGWPELLLRLMQPESRQMMQAMSERARKRVETCYSLEQTMAGYEDVYNSAVTRSRGCVP